MVNYCTNAGEFDNEGRGYEEPRRDTCFVTVYGADRARSVSSARLVNYSPES